MNALSIISKKAENLIDELWKLEEERIEGICNNFEVFCESLDDTDNFLITLRKYLFTQCIVWDTNKREFVAPNSDDYDQYEQYRMINESSTVRREGDLIKILKHPRADYDTRIEKMKTDFRLENLTKLYRALGKHITDDMSVRDLEVELGAVGAEISCVIDDEKYFHCRGKICGGGVQTFHYRYFNTFKKFETLTLNK